MATGLAPSTTRRAAIYCRVSTTRQEEEGASLQSRRERCERLAAELMLVDCAVVAYYHTLRINGWTGNFAALIEAESFGTEGPSARLQGRYGRDSHRIDGLRVEDHLQRIGEQLLPLLDRSNRMLTRNLKALHALVGGTGAEREHRDGRAG